MRQFSLVTLFALLTTLLAVAFADDYAEDVTTTIYQTSTITKTVYMVKTQTLTGYGYATANSTVTYTGTGSVIYPTGGYNATGVSSPSPSSPPYSTGAAASLPIPQSFLAAVLAGVALLAL